MAQLIGTAPNQVPTNGDLGSAAFLDSSAFYSTGLNPAFRNKIINGNFDYWQRGTSTSTAGYLADRWYTNSAGSTFTSSRQSFTLGQTAVPNEPTYFHRTVVTSVAGTGNQVVTYQKIESVRTLAGQTSTLSFWAKADASKNIAVEYVQLLDRKSTRLNSSHTDISRMPSSA